MGNVRKKVRGYEPSLALDLSKEETIVVHFTKDLGGKSKESKVIFYSIFIYFLIFFFVDKCILTKMRSPVLKASSTSESTFGLSSEGS